MGKKPRVRSPQYPYVGLRAAVDKAQELYVYAKRNTVNVGGVLEHWGFSGDTGSSRKTLAALKYFGLIEQGYGSKEVKLTDRALRILLDHEDSEERKNALFEAFVSPKLYAHLWDKWHNEMPHDKAIKSYLIFSKGFNESKTKGFIEDYKQSLEYANIAKSDTIDSNEVQVGDWVQWESQGVLQFIKPMQVSGFSDDGDYLFVTGNASGIPVDEVEVVDAPETGGGQSPLGITPPVFKGENMLQDVVNLKGGQQIIIQYPSELTAENYEDFTDWLLFQHRKIGRSVEGENKPKLKLDDNPS